MNRREFGKMIAGTGVAAALPASGAATVSAQRSKYIFAVALAHAKTDVSADMIAETFNLRPSAAQQIFAKLIRKGVVDVPNASGMARLAEPLQRIVPQVVEYNPLGGYIIQGRIDDLALKAKDVAKRVLEDGAPDENDDLNSDLRARPSEDRSEDEAQAVSPSASCPALPEASGAARSAG